MAQMAVHRRFPCARTTLYGDALRRSAKRFGAKIVQEKVFEDTGGARRTDSGVAQIQRQMPVFTQGAPAYDVLVAADESDVFAAYLPYRTWDPRPVAGSAGLVPTTWDASHDQWGAVQMQNRFTKMFGRRMTARDMQAWSAVRMIGEGAARTGSFDPRTMLDYLKGPDFALAAFKGQRLTAAGLESPIASADPAHRRQDGRLGLSAGGLSASGLGAGHAWRRPARKQMQAEMIWHEACKVGKIACRAHGLVGSALRRFCPRERSWNAP